MAADTTHGAAPLSAARTHEVLSPWWRRASLLVMGFGLAVLVLLTVKVYGDAPPIPGRVLGPQGAVVYTAADVRDGQQVFLRYGLMENGSIWGHGALLGPDYSAQALHSLAMFKADRLARLRFGRAADQLSPLQRVVIQAEVASALKQNRFDAAGDLLRVEQDDQDWFQGQAAAWATYFSTAANNGGLRAAMISDPAELRSLSAFVTWTAWAAAATRPGTTHSYTNNFPYDPDAGNVPPADAVLWSALSLVFLLGGTAAVLLAFGKFDYLGWKSTQGSLHPAVPGARVTPAQAATLKYFALVTVLLLAQGLIGGAVAHYRADPGSFYGLDLAAWLPSNLLRTWHLQLALFWIATAFVAGALFLAAALGGSEPRGQARAVTCLFWALVAIVLGSLLGEWAGMRQLLPTLWFWFGDQGWEYLELGRAWQMLLAVALLCWFALLVRAVAPALHDAARREIAVLFLCAAIAIPVFYLPAMFFDGRSHFSVVDAWRFWIIHLWVEGFFEFFVTVMVAIIFLQFGVVSRGTATRVIYLDAILYFAGGFIGTGHHWYWTGQTSFNMAASALFSALEVVPLTLITLDAWDFVRIARRRGAEGTADAGVPHRWTFYFLMAVGFWNFVGAGVFGFLVNLPIVSYFEAGTLLTINHAHATMMGVFGMLGIALVVFAIRQTAGEALWRTLERSIRLGFWGLNGGLLLMLVLSLFPAGVLQLVDVLEHGYWHARSRAYAGGDIPLLLEWARMPGDVVFLAAGVLPIATAAVRAFMVHAGVVAAPRELEEFASFRK